MHYLTRHGHSNRTLLSENGFSLIELMVVLAIVAIGAGIAYSGYNKSVLKSNRAEAKTQLMQIAQQLERCMSLYGKYDDASCAYKNGTSYNSERGLYSSTVTSTSSTFSVKAQAPSGSRQTKDTGCKSLTLDYLGNKTSTNSADAAVTDCW